MGLLCLHTKRSLQVMARAKCNGTIVLAYKSLSLGHGQSQVQWDYCACIQSALFRSWPEPSTRGLLFLHTNHSLQVMARAKCNGTIVLAYKSLSLGHGQSQVQWDYCACIQSALFRSWPEPSAMGLLCLHTNHSLQVMARAKYKGTIVFAYKSLSLGHGQSQVQWDYCACIQITLFRSWPEPSTMGLLCLHIKRSLQVMARAKCNGTIVLAYKSFSLGHGQSQVQWDYCACIQSALFRSWPEPSAMGLLFLHTNHSLQVMARAKYNGTIVLAYKALSLGHGIFPENDTCKTLVVELCRRFKITTFHLLFSIFTVKPCFS